MSKAQFNTVTSTNLPDNNSRYITPSRHRTVLEYLRDQIGWLDEVNTWVAVNVFSAGTREAWADLTGTGTVTISTTANNLLINTGVTQVNLPASPTDGDWYLLKNITASTVTLSGNGINIYASSSTATKTIGAGQSYKVRYNSGDNLWYNTGITGVDSNIATFLETPSSANLAAAVTGETGTGALVFGTSPTFTTGITTANLTATGTRTFGANGRTIMIDKTVTLTDATATTIATLTLPTGSNLSGGYTVNVQGMIININGITSGAVGGKRIDATFSFGQDATATSSEGVKTTNSSGTSFGDVLTARDLTLTSVGVAISGTDNSTHEIQLNVDGTGSSSPPVISFIGTITIHWFTFKTFSAQ